MIIFSPNSSTDFLPFVACKKIISLWTGHIFRSPTLVFFLLFFLLFTMPLPGLGSPLGEKEYKKAKDYYYTLERDPMQGEERDNWILGVRNFRQIYLSDTKGELAPSSLYMMARMHRRMYHKFSRPVDQEEAIGYYIDVATIFPKNNLADDALFHTAEIHRTNKKNSDQAVKLYRQVVQNYPDGDKYAKALDRLHQLEPNDQIAIPNAIAQSQAGHELVNVLPVKYWSSDTYTRIVIRCSAPVHFKSNLLEKKGNKPRRLYLDFNQSYIPPQYRSPVPIRDGLLNQIRSGQFNNNTVRVVLDIESIKDYKIFQLKDPFRVVVDVHGEKKGDKPKQHPLETISATASRTKNLKQQRTRDDLAQVSGQTSGHPFVTLRDSKKYSPESYKSIAPDSSATKKFSLAQQLGLGVRKIIIDPGHGGKDPGATAFGIREKDIVLKVAKKVKYALANTYGYEVILTRETDVFLPLEERTAKANLQNGDLFLSIHVNAHPKQSVGGIETFYLNLATNTEAMRVAALENATSSHNISELQDILKDLMTNSKIDESSRLADIVQTNLLSEIGPKYKVRNLGVKQAPFYVLIGAEMPAILTEISFITNKKEAKLLTEESYLSLIADKLASGMAKYIKHQSTAALITN